MTLIDTEEAAKRLARVILSDIRLYNREKIRAGSDLRSEIEEGYALFRKRVAPDLAPLYAAVLADNGLPVVPARPAAAAPAARPAVAPPAARPTVAPPATVPHLERRPAPVAMVSPPLWAPAPVAPAPSPVAPARPVAAPAPVATARPVAAPVPVPAPAVRPTAQPSPAGAHKARVDDEEAARRLARVILSDIRVYNPRKVAAKADLSDEINDGRLLFRSRVNPALTFVYEEVLGDSGLIDSRSPAPPLAPPRYTEPPQSVPVPVSTDEVTVRNVDPASAETAPPPVYTPAPEAPTPPRLPARRPTAPSPSLSPAAVVAAAPAPAAVPIAAAAPAAAPAPAAIEPARPARGELVALLRSARASRLLAAAAAIAAAAALVYYLYSFWP
jgi:hypothetical protein